MARAICERRENNREQWMEIVGMKVEQGSPEQDLEWPWGYCEEGEKDSG